MLPTCFPQARFISSQKHKVGVEVVLTYTDAFLQECEFICPLLFFSDGCCIKRHLQLWAFSLACDPAGECFPRTVYTSKADAQQPGMGDVPSYTLVTEQGM